MTKTKAILLSASLLYTFACSEAPQKESGIKKAADATVAERPTDRTGAIEFDITSQGYSLDQQRIEEPDFPLELKDDLALFHLTLQSGDSHVLNSTLNVITTSDDCTARDFDAIEDFDERFMDEVKPDSEKVETKTDELLSEGIIPIEESDQSHQRLAEDSYKLPMKACNNRTVVKFIVPTAGSNFFSVIIKRSEKIYIEVSAEGYFNKRLVIDGQKAKYLALSINMNQNKYYDCPKYSTELPKPTDVNYKELSHCFEVDAQ